jgi:hypothetical protein
MGTSEDPGPLPTQLWLVQFLEASWARPPGGAEIPQRHRPLRLAYRCKRGGGSADNVAQCLLGKRAFRSESPSVPGLSALPQPMSSPSPHCPYLQPPSPATKRQV